MASRHTVVKPRMDRSDGSIRIAQLRPDNCSFGMRVGEKAASLSTASPDNPRVGIQDQQIAEGANCFYAAIPAGRKAPVSILKQHNIGKPIADELRSPAP